MLSFADLCNASPPKFAKKTQFAKVFDLADQTPGENITVHSRSGVLKFKDDKLDTHTVSFTPLKSGYLGSFSLGPVNQTADTFAWTFRLPDSKIDFLQAGQRLVQNYYVTVTDGSGQKSTAVVTVIISGTNDAPVITSEVQSANITEVADGAANENAVMHTGAGAVSFKDVDILDSYTAHVEPLGQGYIGTLSIGAVDQSRNSIPWTFEVADGIVDPLGPDDVLVQKYLVTVDDGHGGTASRVVTVTIHGTNDGAAIIDLAPAAQGGDVTTDEDDLPAGSDNVKASLTATGAFTISAPDGLDELKVGGHSVIVDGLFTPTSFTTPLGNTLSFISFNSTTGVVAYSLTLTGAAAHAGGQGENNLFEHLVVVLTDTDGSSATALLDVRIIDDVPHAVSGIFSGPVDEDGLADGIAGGIGDVTGEAKVLMGTVTNLFEPGADGPLTYQLSNSFGSLPLLSSGGATISYALAGNTLTASAGPGNPVFTFALDATTGTWVFTLLQPLDHTPGDDENDITIAFGSLIQATDKDGDSVNAIGAITITVDDDTPTVGSNTLVELDDDALAGGVSGGTGDGTDSANVTGTLSHAFGADGGSVGFLTSGNPLGFTYDLSGSDLLVKQGGTTVLTATLNTVTGDYTVTQNAPLLHEAGHDETNQSFTLTYRVTDRDGDTVDGTLSIVVNDDTPTVGSNALVELDDDALAGGISGGTGDGTDSANVAGTLSHAFGADGGSVGFLTSGNPLGFTYDLSGSDLLVKQGGTTVLTATLNTATGDYTVTQNAPLLHEAGHDETNQSFTLTYRVTDRDGDTVDGTLSIVVNDDTPVAGPITKSSNTPEIDSNIMLILDVSGSMNELSGVAGLTRLEVLKAAVLQLLEQYDSLGNVAVRIVTFSDIANPSGLNWQDITNAEASILGLTAEGQTNYDEALTDAVAAFGSFGKLGGAQNVVYFVSDGEPNLPTASQGINTTEQATWERFLDTNNVVSFALGVDTDVTTSALDPVAYNGITNAQIPSFVVTDLSQLTTTLVGTVNAITTLGNLLSESGGSFGADGGFVSAITVDGDSTFTYNPVAHTVTETTLGGSSHTFVAATNVLAITTAIRGFPRAAGRRPQVPGFLGNDP